MELVVKIDEETYEDIKKGKVYTSFRDVPQEAVLAIANGTSLPKGHGRLIDGDKLIRPEIQPFLYHLENGDTAIPEIDILHAPTIIEADKEYEAEVITRGNCMMCGKELTEGLFFCKECEAKVIQGRK